MAARHPHAVFLISLFAFCLALVPGLAANSVPINVARDLQKTPVGSEVTVEGVVTYRFAGSLDFFLQDDTAGIYVVAGPRFQEHTSFSTKVLIRGTTAAGEFAPTLVANEIEEIGAGNLPAPHATTYAHLMTGREDCQRVTVHGLVRAATTINNPWHGKNLVLTVFEGKGEIIVRTPDIGERSVESWVDNEITVHGVAGGIFNRAKQMIGLIVYAPELANFEITSPSLSDPFASAAVPAGSLMQFSPSGAPIRRVKVEGVVLYSGSTRTFINDASGGAEIRAPKVNGISVGDQVEAVGFPAFGEYSPVLENATLRKVKAGWPIQAKLSTPTQILDQGLTNQLVTVHGELLDQLVDSEQQTLVLRSERREFYARLKTGDERLPPYPKHSLLAITGVALVQVTGPAKYPDHFELLMRNPSDVQVIDRPSWWTLGRTLSAALVATVTLLGAGGWVTMVARRNAKLSRLIRDRQHAEDELQKAKNELERRVEERTAQLYEEINGRERVEAEFSAVLKERERIAQEIHDTLEQGLVGIGLQVDSAAQVFNSDPNTAARHIALAANLVRHSQAETRRSVWDLRSQSLEEGDLVTALSHVCRSLSTSNAIDVRLEVFGLARRVLVLTENNVFRIAQEAITNALKHARAAHIVIDLRFEPSQIRLSVRDDGVGFDIAGHLPSEGHFGLQGIRERAKRISGTLAITSEPGRGTCVEVTAPVPPVAADPTGKADSQRLTLHLHDR